MMTLQKQYTSQNQGKKVGDGDDNDNDNDLKLVSKILKEANKDILLEIFVRLPDCRSVILFGSVCRYWHSLISGPQFIQKFISHHREHLDRYSLPYTIIFRRADRVGLRHSDYYYYRPLCKLFSEESMFLHGMSVVTTATYLSFLPCRMVIRSSCNDLLLAYLGAREYLVTRWSKPDDLYICSPVRKQYYRLPQFSRPTDWYRVTGHALICMPIELGSHFKVVEFYDIRFDDRESEECYSHVMSVFCSESGKWDRECFQCPRPNGYSPYSCAKEMEEVVTCNGIMYWLENHGDVDRVIALDLWNRECGVIVFPDDFWWFPHSEVREERITFWRFRQYQDSHVREQIGAVCGELRLLQVVLTGAALNLNLKIWKLNDYHNKDWVLVHDKKNLKRPSDDVQQFTAAFVHPTNGDVVFLVWDEKVFEYNLIMDDKYEMMGKLEDSLDIKWRSEKAAQFGWNERLVSLPIVHPPWPTALPSL